MTIDASIQVRSDALFGADRLARQLRAAVVWLARARSWTSWLALAARSDEAAGTRVSASQAATPEMARAFERVALPHLDAAYSLARYLTGDADASEDIVQQAYLKAFAAFSDFRGGDARAWILAIVRNGARDWRAAQGRLRRRFVALEPLPDGGDGDVPEEVIETIAADIISAEAGLMRRQEDGLVRSIVDRLPEPLRDVLMLREMEDLSYREIAEVAGIPMGTVMSRLARAREAFAKLWQRLSVAEEGRR